MRIKKLLIVDDSETSRMIIKRCWQIAGFIADSIVEAEDGLKALSVVTRDSIDFIITDINMPRMDGKTMIRKIRSNPESSKIPIAVISSMKNGEMEDWINALDVHTVIAKPLTPQKFINSMGASDDGF